MAKRETKSKIYARSDASRYFITSPSFNLEEDKLALTTIGLSYTSLTYGFTDKISVEVGTSFASALLASPFIGVSLKFNFLKSESFNLGASLNYYITLPQQDENTTSLLLMSVKSTVGDISKNFTFGIGYGLINVLFLKHK